MAISKNKNIATFGLYVNNSVTEKLKTLTVPETDSINLDLIEKKLGEPHPFDYTLIDGLMKKFGLATAVIEKMVDFAFGPKLNVECKDTRAKQILDDFLNKTYLRSYIKPWAREGLAKGPGFMEIAGLADKSDDEIAIKVPSSNNMYVRRDKYGNVEKFIQHVGSNLNRISEKDIVELNPDEMVQVDFNKWGNCAYGYGYIYSALQTIDDFLMAQKAIHKLTKRKANMPIWVKLGNVEKEDYPQQAQIDAFGEKLQYMDETTEWVTGPNVEITAIDTGNVAEKFIGVLNNDYKLLSYSFQVPETIMGAGNVPEGLAKVQMDAFDRRIKSLQDEVGMVIKEKILRKILKKNGLDVEFNVVWGELNEEDKEKLIMQYNSILGNMSVSPGLKKEVEKKLALLLDINIEAVEANNAEMEGSEEENPEREREENEKLPEVPGQKSLEGVKYKEVHNTLYEDTGSIRINEWINFNYNDLKNEILQAVRKDKFDDLRATNAIEREAGYLSAAKVRQLKEIFEKGFDKNLSVKELEQQIQKVVGPLYKYDENGLVLDNGERVIKLDSVTRSNVIARTETVRLANIGNLDFYKTKKVDEVRFVASLSDRTCPECEGLNGNIYNISEAYDTIPVHINCRCAFVPIVQEKVKETEI